MTRIDYGVATAPADDTHVLCPRVVDVVDLADVGHKDGVAE